MFVLLFIAIAIKESAKIGDKTQRRAAKGIDDLGKYTLCSSCLLTFHQASLEAYIILIVVLFFKQNLFTPFHHLFYFLSKRLLKGLVYCLSHDCQFSIYHDISPAHHRSSLLFKNIFHLTDY